MAVTWKVVQLDRLLKDGDKSDVVKTVHWEATDSATDGGKTYEGRVYGSIGLDEPTDSFTPYADITEEQAITWAKSALGEDQVAAEEKSVEIK